MPDSKRYGARVRAYNELGTVVKPWSEMLEPIANHERAAHVLAHKLGWASPLGVTLKHEALDSGYVFTVVE